MDLLTDLLGRNGYLPHGYCFTWTPGLLWSMVGADGVIAAAYFSIPIALVSFVRRRPEASTNWLIWLFSAFIFACGVTHVIDIWTIWQPYYGAQALSKIVTAVISIVTAIALWPLIPKALKIPSVEQLQAMIRTLETQATRLRDTEESLVDTQQSLAVTLASVDAGFIATDRAGCVTRMNEVAERVTGWSQAGALGQSLWTVFGRGPGSAATPAMNPVDLLIRDGVDVNLAHQVATLARDATRTELEVKAALTRSAGGEVRGVAMVFRDLTAMRRAELESSRLAAIVASSSDAIIGKTLDGRITAWNAAAQELFGYRADEAVGRSIRMLFPQERDNEEIRILAELARGSSIAPFDTVRVAKDGRLLDVSVTISPIRDAQGRIVGASKIARDMSHRRNAELARRKAERLEAENRQIQESNRLKSQFLANMSHELRTPLNAIIGFADLLETGTLPPDSPKHRRFLGHIGTSGRHLLKLINDVLDLSKVESGKFEFFPERVDLAVLSREVGDILHTALERKRLQLVIDIDPGLDEVVLDPGRLKQVLYNFMSNAIKFTAADGRVTVRALPEGDAQLRIEVEDTGIGIAEADLPRLFSEFQQLDGGHDKQHEGTGLGLALSRRLVEAQGGSVGVRSVPGTGSVFHLVLPRTALQQPQLLPEAPGGIHSFLVIEDDPADQALLVRSLSESGFRVEAASTAEQAVELAAQRAYAAITLDLLLPDKRGLDALARIRDQGPSRASPVVALAMQGNGGAAAFAIDNVLSKPIQTAEVIAAMAGLTRFQEARVLVIDDDPLALELMRTTLQGIGIESMCLLDARAALRDIERHRPDAIVLDLMMPGFDGFAVLDALHRMPRWRSTPVFIWTSMILTDAEYASLGATARAIVAKGGGAVAEVLERLRTWRPPLAIDVGPDDPP